MVTFLRRFPLGVINFGGVHRREGPLVGFLEEQCLSLAQIDNVSSQRHGAVGSLMTHKYRGSQQSSREVKPKLIDSTQGEPKNICKP
jgi:hypothetical protein